MERDADELRGPPYGRQDGELSHRWRGFARELGFHGGTMVRERPRVRGCDGEEMALASREATRQEAGWDVAR
jgi:hypothetical protein